MASPEIKIIALSNVFSRMMHFKNKGDVEQGHKHNYDHATLVSRGSVLVEMLDDNGNVEHSKVFNSPDMIFINKNKYHKLTSLEEETVCVCIHAIRSVDEEIVDPRFLVEPLVSTTPTKLHETYNNTYNEKMLNFTKGPKIELS